MTDTVNLRNDDMTRPFVYRGCDLYRTSRVAPTACLVDLVMLTVELALLYAFRRPKPNRDKVVRYGLCTLKFSLVLSC